MYFSFLAHHHHDSLIPSASLQSAPFKNVFGFCVHRFFFECQMNGSSVMNYSSVSLDSLISNSLDFLGHYMNVLDEHRN